MKVYCMISKNHSRNICDNCHFPRKKEELDPILFLSEVAQLCPTLCNPMDCSPLVSSVHGIPQARILEWVAIPFSRGSS